MARFGERRLILLGQASLVVAFAGIATLSHPLLIALFTVPLAFGNGVNLPSLQSLITRFGDETSHGRLLGLYQSSRSLALIVGPIFAGLVFQTISPRAPFVLAVPLLLISIGLSLYLQRRVIPTQTRQPVES